MVSLTRNRKRPVRKMTDSEIETAIAGARNNQELEGLRISARTQDIGRRFLRGEITAEAMRKAILNDA